MQASKDMIVGILGAMLVIAGILLFWSVTGHAQQCMQMGQMYQCSDGTQGMQFGNQSQWHRSDGTTGQSMDLGNGMGQFNEGQRQGTYQQFGQQGLWQDQEGRRGQWQDLGPTMRQFSGPSSSGLYGPSNR